MCFRRRKKVTISLLVPYQSSGDDGRDASWAWLREYWKLLPDSEIVMGRDKKSKRWFRKRRPFSKTAAVNQAFRKSRGDIIVILDADAYLPHEVIQHCAERLRACREAGVQTWFVPYQRIYRLTEDASLDVILSDPADPPKFSSPPPAELVEGTDGSGLGRLYGAMCQIMPREAFEAAGWMDNRFIGWGGEDVALLKAVDTLWGPHKNTPTDILHLWHKRAVSGAWTDRHANIWEVRIWEGQTAPRMNDALASRYNQAAGKPEKMKALVEEHKALRRLSMRWFSGR
jgi:glycosyltransferase involved in cell wall biosynthesis